MHFLERSTPQLTGFELCQLLNQPLITYQSDQDTLKHHLSESLAEAQHIERSDDVEYSYTIKKYLGTDACTV